MNLRLSPPIVLSEPSIFAPLAKACAAFFGLCRIQGFGNAGPQTASSIIPVRSGSTLLRGACAGIAIVLTSASVFAETLVTDKFPPENRSHGNLLNGLAIGNDGVVWEASGNVALAGAGDARYVTFVDASQVKTSGPFSARLPLPSDAEVIVVEAEVHPTESGASGWIGVGIGSNGAALGNPSLGGVILCLSPSGRYGCTFNSDPSDWEGRHLTTIGGGEAPDFDPDSFNRIKLQFNRKTGVLDAWINGKQVLDQVSLGKNITLPCDFAGFSGFRQAGGTKSLDSFHLSFIPGQHGK